MLVERTVGGLHAHLIHIVNKLGVTANSHVLDIGCGSGAWLARLQDNGLIHLVGIDQTLPRMVAGLDLRQADINKPAVTRSGIFQLVTCIEVIEHVENVGHLLDLIKQSLAVDGVAIITTPNIESLRARTRALLAGKIPSFDHKSDPTHLMPILHASLQKMLHRRDLRIVAVRQYPENPSASLMFSARVNYMSRLLRAVLPDDLHGDNTIYLIKHLVKEKCC